MAAYLAVALAVAGAAQAHFNLQSPTSIGFSDDLESTAPCGSFTPDFNNGTIQDWHVGGDFISTKLGHPTATWLYRATLDKTAAGGWVELYPIFQQNGLGVYCQPSVAGGADFVGKQGVLSVVANAPDGLLYQCATVNFVAGTAPAPTSGQCNNGSGVSAAFKDDSTLTALLSSSSSSNSTSSSGSSSSMSPTTSGTATGASSSPSASHSGNAASGLVVPSYSVLGSLVVASVMGCIGALLL